MAEDMRACNRCGGVKPLSDFYRNPKDRKYGRGWECKACTKFRSAERQRLLREQLRPATQRYSRASQRRARARDLGLTPERLAEVEREQAGLCAICHTAEVAARGTDVRALAMDHDHISGAFRALLCSNCNRGLGNFRDDPSLLRAAAEYLERHRQEAFK